jgi:phosphopantothenoylcysteine decarboxylase/phosphopantothenate--cysteine ligase
VVERITLLEGKHIVLGVTGSIAAYKAVDFASKLTQAGALVDVVMTEAAQHFVTPLAFQTVTGRPVYTDLWQADSSGGLPTHIAHVGLAEGADLFIIAPATANTIAHLAHGIADTLLTLTALAVICPVLIAPAMDGGMYNHPATQENLQTLANRGLVIIEPEEGRFASGLVGKGRLPETPVLLGRTRQTLGRSVGKMTGRKVIVTAGGTREALDLVRYISNHSSGKQGYAVAQAAVDAGADVVLISTISTLPVPIGVQMVPVASAHEMLVAVKRHVVGADALIMAAAVADFRPATAAVQKIKKSHDSDEGLTLTLVKNPDILLEVKSIRAKNGWPRVTVGFAAESEDLLENALSKLERKGLDLIVANDISASDAGFQADTNRVVILDASGGQQHIDLISKTRISEVILARIAELLGR